MTKHKAIAIANYNTLSEQWVVRGEFPGALTQYAEGNPYMVSGLPGGEHLLVTFWPVVAPASYTDDDQAQEHRATWRQIKDEGGYNVDRRIA